MKIKIRIDKDGSIKAWHIMIGLIVSCLIYSISSQHKMKFDNYAEK